MDREHNIEGQTAPSHLWFCHHNSISTDISFCSNSNSDDLVSTKFCTCYDSTAVVPCAKICGDIIARNGITMKWNFNGIWIAMQKLWVKLPATPLYGSPCGLLRDQPSSKGDLARGHGTHTPDGLIDSGLKMMAQIFRHIFQKHLDRNILYFDTDLTGVSIIETEMSFWQNFSHWLHHLPQNHAGSYSINPFLPGPRVW